MNHICLHVQKSDTLTMKWGLGHLFHLFFGIVLIMGTAKNMCAKVLTLLQLKSLCLLIVLS